MQSSEFSEILECLQSQQDLTTSQMQTVISSFLAGQTPADQTRRFLELLQKKGETVDELVGAAQAMRDAMIPVQSSHPVIVDTCGTGGDGSSTFNISTAAAIVVAAAGVPVAKHGNRKITSSTGSADVLSELGVNLEADVPIVTRCLQEAGICFCFAPHFHPAMRHVGPIRRQIEGPTIFNRLGPLTNPASAGYQVLGVGNESLQDKLAATLAKLGTENSVVVRGDDGVDEVSLSAPTRVLRIHAGEISEATWNPEDFGVAKADRNALFADSPSSSAARIRAVLQGELGPPRDVVVINAAAAIWLANPSQTLQECAQQACHAIDSDAASDTLSKLATLTSQ